MYTTPVTINGRYDVDVTIDIESRTGFFECPMGFVPHEYFFILFESVNDSVLYQAIVVNSIDEQYLEYQYYRTTFKELAKVKDIVPIDTDWKEVGF